MNKRVQLVKTGQKRFNKDMKIIISLTCGACMVIPAVVVSNTCSKWPAKRDTSVDVPEITREINDEVKASVMFILLCLVYLHICFLEKLLGRSKR